MSSTKDIIKTAAKQVLIEEGSNGFSMRKVATEAGISLSNVQYHFKTQDALIKGLLFQYLEDFQQLLSPTSENEATGKTNLNQLVLDILNEESNSDDIKFSIALTSFAEQSNINAHFDEFFQKFHTLLIEFLTDIADKDCQLQNIQKGAAILLPFINGYGLVSKHLKIDAAESATLLTNLVWNTINQFD